jgi:hypothetical protein
MSRQQSPVFIAICAIVVTWILAWSGYVIFKHSKITAEKVKQYQASMDLAHLSTADRLKALKGLVERLNALSPEEREKWKLEMDWFRQLTEEEKAYFIDAFMPGEMKLALQMFERWPKARQQEEIDHAFKELQANAATPGRRTSLGPGGTNAPPVSPELDKKIRTLGLNTLYSQGSAQTKAELAPLLIEVQHQFESGQLNLNGF